jgi:excisionase family DNA binding protein
MTGTGESERKERLYIENDDGTLERVYTVVEAATRLGLTYGGVIKMLHRDILAATRLGGQVWLIRESDLRRVQEARETLRPKKRSA